MGFYRSTQEALNVFSAPATTEPNEDGPRGKHRPMMDRARSKTERKRRLRTKQPALPVPGIHLPRPACGFSASWLSCLLGGRFVVQVFLRDHLREQGVPLWIWVVLALIHLMGFGRAGACGGGKGATVVAPET